MTTKKTTAKKTTAKKIVVAKNTTTKKIVVAKSDTPVSDFAVGFRKADRIQAEKPVSGFIMRKTDSFRKPRLAKGVCSKGMRGNQLYLTHAPISKLGVPYLCNQVQGYALALSEGLAVPLTRSLLLAVSEHLGFEGLTFNKKSFVQQLFAQIDFDEHLRECSCSVIETKQECLVFNPRDRETRHKLLACVSP